MKLSPKAILLPTIALFIIAMLVAAALAGTNLITAAKIEEVNLQNEQQSCFTVLPEAEEFQEKRVIEINGEEYEYYAGVKDDQIAGYAFITTGSGYGGKIKVVTGIDKDGTITGVYMLDIANETPGLGQNVSGDFKDQIPGHTADEGSIAVTKDGGEINAVSGATITSRAVTSAVSTAMQGYSNVKEAA